MVGAILKVVSSDVGRKRKIQPHLEGDFIDAALAFDEPFDTKLWPKDKTSTSANRKFPEVGDGKGPLLPALQKFVHFSRRLNHRPLPELNAENPFKAKPRKDALEALRKKYPGNISHFNQSAKL